MFPFISSPKGPRDVNEGQRGKKGFGRTTGQEKRKKKRIRDGFFFLLVLGERSHLSAPAPALRGSLPSAASADLQANKNKVDQEGGARKRRRITQLVDGPLAFPWCSTGGGRKFVVILLVLVRRNFDPPRPPYRSVCGPHSSKSFSFNAGTSRATHGRPVRCAPSTHTPPERNSRDPHTHSCSGHTLLFDARPRVPPPLPPLHPPSPRSQRPHFLLCVCVPVPGHSLLPGG